MIERQVITTWNVPEESKGKLPEDDSFVIVTVSGKCDNVTYDHAFAIANYIEDDDGWYFDDPLLERFRDNITVHAWADLEPYGGHNNG